MKIFLTFAITGFLAALALAQGQPGANEMNPEIAEMLSTNPPPKGFATRLDYIKSFSSYEAIDKAYRSGKISKEEAMLAMKLNPVAPSDKASMDYYGKVIDQSGQPVVDAKVRGWLEYEMAEDKENDTKTDAQGRFHFLGLQGKGLGITLEKEGYDFNRDIKFAVNRPNNYLPDPNNPVIVQMWKLRGAEPMTHTMLYSHVPMGDSGTNFDLLRDKCDPDGELLVKVTRHPMDIERLKPFDWSVTFEITNGGLIECTNIYPYEAPAEGYQQILTLNFPTNMVGWQRNFYNRPFYFKSQGGQKYGRMTISIDASLKEHASFNAVVFANPAGSRNLEFDGNKFISFQGLSEKNVRRLATQYRDEWLQEKPPVFKSMQAPFVSKYAPVFAKSSIASIEKMPDGWHVAFIAPGETNLSIPGKTNKYRFYVDLAPDGSFYRLRPVMANEHIIAGQDSIWGSSVLHVERVDNNHRMVEGIRIISHEPDGQTTTIKAAKGMIEPVPDLSAVKIKLFQAHIEKTTATTYFPTYEITLSL